MINRVLITGDRNWTDKELIRSWLSKLQDFGCTDVIEGEARGADSIARDEALRLGMIVHKYPAQWEKYGRFAGPVRNRQMLDEGKPDIVVYFHYNMINSKGTKDMVQYAIKKNVPVYSGIREKYP